MKKRLLGFAAPAALFALMSLASGCSKTYIDIDLGGGSGGDGGGSGLSLVSFHASVESRNITRSMSPLSKNVMAVLYTYDGADKNADGTPVAVGNYESLIPGTLTGLNGYKMYLTNDTYDFYAVSDNLPTPPAAFSGGQSEPLVSGVDYLWWHAGDQDVASAQISIPIVFTHSATQVSFEVAAGEGVTLDRLVSARIIPTASGARMDLTTGLISSEVSYASAAVEMGVNGRLAQYIMLPLKTSVSMQVSFTVLINGETANRTYSVAAPVPDNVLAAGNSYRFKAVIRGNGVSFPSVGVADWVDVDETGKPLYPLQ